MGGRRTGGSKVFIYLLCHRTVPRRGFQCDWGGRARLHHYGRNLLYQEKAYDQPVYWLPIEAEVNAANWQEVRGRRRTFTLPPLEVDLEVREVAKGFDLHITTSNGLEDVPFQIKCVFEPGGELELESGLIQATADHTVF